MRIYKITTGFVTNSSSTSFAILIKREEFVDYDENDRCTTRLEDLARFFARVTKHAQLMNEAMMRTYSDDFNHTTTTIKINRRPWLAVIDVHAQTGSDHSSSSQMHDYLDTLRREHMMDPDQCTTQWFNAFKHCLNDSSTTHLLKKGGIAPLPDEVLLGIGLFIADMFREPRALEE